MKIKFLDARRSSRQNWLVRLECPGKAEYKIWDAVDFWERDTECAVIDKSVTLVEDQCGVSFVVEWVTSVGSCEAFKHYYALEKLRGASK